MTIMNVFLKSNADQTTTSVVKVRLTRKNRTTCTNEFSMHIYVAKKDIRMYLCHLDFGVLSLTFWKHTGRIGFYITVKFFSEALILASTNPQYDKRLPVYCHLFPRNSEGIPRKHHNHIIVMTTLQFCLYFSYQTRTLSIKKVFSRIIVVGYHKILCKFLRYNMGAKVIESFQTIVLILHIA